MRKVRIGITSLATFESIRPPYNLREPSVSENLSLGLSLLDAAGASKVDIAVLPESFPYAGIDGKRISELAEIFPGKCIEAVANKAKQHEMNVVAGFYIYLEGILRNVAILFDRKGSISGIYIKKYTTEGEINGGVIPGVSTNIFQTDVGKIGIAVCFDINWAEIWENFENNADFVCWISAYEGGFPLQSRAWINRIPIATSVMSYHSKFIDISGKILTSTSRWNRVAIIDYNLDREIFHVDGQYDKILELQTKYGNSISIESYTEEHLFLLQSMSEDITLKEIIEKEGLISYKSYIESCSKIVKDSYK
jgi:predicted amidohydrolase